MRRVLAVCLALVASLALAACGGWSSDKSTGNINPDTVKGTVRVIMEEVPDTIVKSMLRRSTRPSPAST